MLVATYDHASRLTEATETPAGGRCTSRAYTYDVDSNRLTKTTRSPGVGDACATSVGTTQSYGYDEADRLIGPTYDAWGRITNLPSEYAGGKSLETSYFANSMVATQSQGGVTNTFQLDATVSANRRAASRASKCFMTTARATRSHGASSALPGAGTSAGSAANWRAVQESNGTTTFKLADLHGDVVASAS